MNTRIGNSYLVCIILAVILALGIVSYFIPVAPGVELQHALAHHIRLALTVVMCAAYCSSGLLFLLALDVFKTKLRRAYLWFCSGAILFGIAMLQWPIIVALGLERSFWAVSGLVVIPFLLATLLMYVGMRRLARLLEVHTILASKLFSTVMVVVFVLASALIAHKFAGNNGPGIETETYTATVAWSTGYGVMAWLLVRKISLAVGPSYRRAMRWLVIAFAALSVGGVHEYLTSYYLTEAEPYVYWGISLWAFIAAGFLFICAGYAMYRTKYVITESVPVLDVSGSNNRASIDSITNIASLASRPEDIDSILDGLREVTAGMQPDVPLSRENYDRLVSVYDRLEQYLITSDPLRAFTKEELRERMSPGLRQYVEQRSSLAPPAETVGHESTAER